MTAPDVALSDRYRLVRFLARGGMADVWEAEDRVLERRVAVKLLRDVSETDTSSFIDEMLALSRLNHPSIVGLFDAGAHDGSLYLVMELVTGRSLREILPTGPLDGPQVRGIARSVAGGLAHAHERAIVHRDVKPGNILVDELGTARLADFGIARVADGTRATVTGATLGTAAYLAPERVTGEPVGPAADVYSLGLVLLEALTGRKEYAGPAVEAAVARLHRAPVVPAVGDRGARPSSSRRCPTRPNGGRRWTGTRRPSRVCPPARARPRSGAPGWRWRRWPCSSPPRGSSASTAGNPQPASPPRPPRCSTSAPGTVHPPSPSGNAPTNRSPPWAMLRPSPPARPSSHGPRRGNRLEAGHPAMPDPAGAMILQVRTEETVRARAAGGSSLPNRPPW